MCKGVFFVVVFSLSTCFTSRVYAQAEEIAQLLLNVEKLSQFKQILQQMYDGYKIISEGYDKVKNITSGNFQLHQVFLDGLYLVNPEIKKYRRVADIIQYQLDMVKEYKYHLQKFESIGVFSQGKLSYISSVYANLLDRSMQNLDELAMVITAQKLRMSDNERLEAIDRIAGDMKNKLIFLRSFNEQYTLLATELQKAKLDIQSLRQWHGVQE